MAKGNLITLLGDCKTTQTDQLILCRSWVVWMQGILIQKKKQAWSKPPALTFSNIYKKILNPKVDLEMWLTSLFMVLHPTVSTVTHWLQKDVTEPKDAGSCFSNVFVGAFKERS